MTDPLDLFNLHQRVSDTLLALCAVVDKAMDTLPPQEAKKMAEVLVAHCEALKGVMAWHESYHRSLHTIKRAYEAK